MIPRFTVLGLLILIVKFSFGCSCSFEIRELTIEEYFFYDHIFVVKIIKEGGKHIDGQQTREVYWAKFELLNLYKGEVLSDTIWSPLSSCRRELNIGEEYLYYGSGNKNHYVGYCSRTKSRNDKGFGDFDQELNLIKVMASSKDANHITFSNGQIIGFGEFKDGYFDGDWVFYFPNGRLRMKGRYENGEKVGKWIEIKFGGEYHDDNYADIVRGVGNYENGERKGEWFYLLTTFSSEENDGIPSYKKY